MFWAAYKINTAIINFLTKMSFTLMQRSAYAVEFVCAAFIVGFCYGIVGVEFEMVVTFIVLLVYVFGEATILGHGHALR